MKFKLWLNVATFVALGLIVLFAWHDIVAAFAKMATLNVGIMLLMLPVQFVAFFAVAKIFFHAFRAIGLSANIRTLFASTIELNFVNHIFPSGGVSGFSYLTMRLKHDDISPAKSTLVQLTRYVFTFIAFVILLLAALVLLAVENRANNFIILIASAITFSLIFLTIGVSYIIGSEGRIKSFTGAFTRMINALIHIFRRSHPETIKLEAVEQVFIELHEDYQLFRDDFSKVKYVLLWAVVACVAEVSLVYVAFAAHGAWVNPGAVVIALAVATLAGLLAFLPGGLGVYEPLMSLVFVSAGVPAATAVSVTLVYRVITLLLALGSGYILYHLALNRRHDRADTER